jgi:leucyl aminopeptidase
MSHPNITVTKKLLSEAPPKYCRIILTEAPTSTHRFVETAAGTTEYRMGAGKWSDVTPRTLRTLIRSIVMAAKSHQVEFVALELHNPMFPGLSHHTPAWFYSTLIENLHLAAYEFKTYKTKPDTKVGLREILVCGISSAEARAGVARGAIVGTATNTARDIANTPGEDMTPAKLAAAAKKIATGTKVSVKVLGRTEIKKLKMGLLEAVAKGSHHTPQFIVMEYWGAGKIAAGKKRTPMTAPLILIGKGITYDSGGLNVKPSGAMHDMHMDMSGGSSVMSALVAAAKLGIKKNIIALIPAAENAISSTSMRAGDIATSMSGQTVEILHTDAEGRLVLADALTYAGRYEPRAILDVATLTGAALVALGQHASAVMTTNTELETELRRLSEESGDLVWPLPLWDEYKSNLKSARADISNIATNFSKFGGAIEGGMFLAAFAPKQVPWAHLDIAPRMDSIPSDKLAKGSTGEPVRLLVAFLEQY